VTLRQGLSVACMWHISCDTSSWTIYCM